MFSSLSQETRSFVPHVRSTSLGLTFITTFRSPFATNWSPNVFLETVTTTLLLDDPLTIKIALRLPLPEPSAQHRGPKAHRQIHLPTACMLRPPHRLPPLVVPLPLMAPLPWNPFQMSTKTMKIWMNSTVSIPTPPIPKETIIQVRGVYAQVQMDDTPQPVVGPPLGPFSIRVR